MLVTKTTNAPERYLDLTDTETRNLTEVAARMTKETMLFHLGLLEDALFAMQRSYAVKRTVAEITLVRMCDPALDSSSESILARLARVEEQLIAGVPVIPAPIAKEIPEPIPESAKPEATAPPAPMAPVQETSAAPVKTTTPATPPAPAADGQQRVLRPIRAWAEIVDRVRATSPKAASFFGRAKAYTTESGQIVIKFASDFERDMARGEGAPEALRAALSVSLGRKIEAQDIVSEVEKEATAEDSLIDLILEAAENADS
jgi:DNA polymerase-3 subunit gamma/tau